MDFLVHRAFYPVLMAQRTGPNKALIERLQETTRNEIERFRSYRSIAEVMINFRRELTSGHKQSLCSDLRMLNLPVIGDLRDDLEEKARELGLDTDTLLTALYPTSRVGV